MSPRRISLLPVAEEILCWKSWHEQESFTQYQRYFLLDPTLADPTLGSYQNDRHSPKIQARGPLSHDRHSPKTQAQGPLNRNHNVQAYVTGNHAKMKNVNERSRILWKAIKGAIKEGKRIGQKH